MQTPAPRQSLAPGRPAHLGWRLLALVYDALPALALCFVGSALGLLLRGGKPVTPDSPAAWLELLALWGLVGVYAVASWARGGQTLGMRPWKLRIVADDGGRPGLRALCLRYLAALFSLAPLGLGFVWSLFDGERRCWHDRLSGTRLMKE